MLVRKVLLAVAALSGLVVLGRMWLGPFTLVLPVGSPLNAEGIFGLAVTLLLVAAGGVPRGAAPDWSRRATWFAIAAVVGVIAVVFQRVLGLYFLADDFFLINSASTFGTNTTLRHIFSHGGVNGFFRPLGDVLYAVEFSWARFDPRVWHASAVFLHACNSVMVLLLARRMGTSSLAGAFGAILFAIHGTRPESVAWIASRFDLLATFFVLLSFLLFADSCTRSGSWRMVLVGLALTAMVAALLSKESAYIFPLLLMLYLYPRRDLPGHAMRSVMPFAVLTMAVFTYRWNVLEGIRGAAEGAGAARMVPLSLVSSVHAAGLRLWSALYFPMNWSSEPSRPLTIFAAAAVVSLLCLAARSRPLPLWSELGFILVSVLPPLYLLGIGADLINSRILYLPSIGFAMLLARAVDGLNSPARYLVPAGIVMFQIAALDHNLAFWEYASEQVREGCEAVRKIPGRSGPLSALGYPERIRGVYAFATVWTCVPDEAVQRR